MTVFLGARRGDLTIRDTTREAGDLFVHHGVLAHGALKVGEAVELCVDPAAAPAALAETRVTHLLHQALRRWLKTTM